VTWLVPTPDGRTLAVEAAGDPDGQPVMVHVGTPGCRRLYGTTVDDAKRRGLRLISYDRPGYGDSTPSPGRSTADCADDVRLICAELGIERLTMWGLSGGGPHVLACAALLPDLVIAAAALCSLAPYDAAGLDWLRGFSPEALDEVELTLSDPQAARELFRRGRAELLGTPVEERARQMKAAGSMSDLSVLVDEATCMQQAVLPGIEGGWDDCVAQLTPWGFEVADITVPVLIAHGRNDRAVPFSHGQWLASHIPGAEGWLIDDEDHGLRERYIGHIHAWLEAQRRDRD
jgi:pimeloyl-ACP methyl ester carboxylesterase